MPGSSRDGSKIARGGGPGVGAPCSVCGKPVSKHEMELEIQFARNEDDPGLDKFHLHVRCFAAWEFERNKVDGAPPGA